MAIPVIGVVSSAVLLGEPLCRTDYAGMVLVVIALTQVLGHTVPESS
ncbi:hypothetical protein CCP1ISM_5330001 [Azospirillaceae bacterium]